MRQGRGKSRGFMLLDAMIGLFIVNMLGLVLALAVGTKYRAQQRLGDLRSANRLAERVLFNLQARQTAPAAGVVIHPVDGDAPEGFEWMIVTAEVRGARASLYGLAPAGGTR